MNHLRMDEFQFGLIVLIFYDFFLNDNPTKKQPKFDKGYFKIFKILSIMLVKHLIVYFYLEILIR